MANGLTNAVRHEFVMIANDRQTFVDVRKHSRSFMQFLKFARKAYSYCFRMYDIHIRPTGPNGNRGKLILLFVYGSRFTIVFQVARRCASASMSANGIVGQSMRRLPSGYWVPFTVRAIRCFRKHRNIFLLMARHL